MTNINNTDVSYFAPRSNANEPDEESFNDKVLHYIEMNKPEGSLSELMAQMRALSPDKAVTMQQLDQALLYSDVYLRNSEASKEYTDNVLDRFTTQLQGVNTLVNNMMYENLTKTDDETSL